MSESKPGTPAWLQYGLPAVLVVGGIVSMIRRELFISGGSRGGSGQITGNAAIIAGGVMILLGLLAFWFFRRIGRKAG